MGIARESDAVNCRRTRRKDYTNGMQCLFIQQAELPPYGLPMSFRLMKVQQPTEDRVEHHNWI